jgi:lambda family phage tail tape measure protein
MVEAYPKQAANIKDLYNWIRQETKARQERADLLEREGREDNADNWAKMYQAAAKSMEEYQKALTETRQLELEMNMDRINAEEKFYEISSSEAASKRTAVLREQLALKTEDYLAAEKEGAIGDLSRTKALDQIAKINTQLLEQKKILSESTAFGGMIAGLKEYGRSAVDVGSQVKQAFIGAFTGIENALVEFVRHGKLNFTDLANSILDDIARIAVRTAVTGPLSSWLGTLMSAAPAAAQYLPGSTEGGGLLGGTSAGGLSSLVGAMGSAVKMGAATGTEAGAAAGIGSMLPVVGLAVAGGMVAYQFGSDFFGKGGLWNNSTGSQKAMRTASATSIIGLPLFFADYFTGGGLFGTAWKTTGAGVSLGVDNGSIAAQNYVESSRKKGWFRGSESRTQTSAVDAEFASYLSDRYTSVISGITGQSSLLGGNGGLLSSFSFGASKVALAGRSAEDQQKAIDTWFAGMTNAAIDKVYPELSKFRKMGEDSAATFARLTASGRAVNDFFTALGLTLNEVSLAGAAASDSLVQALGGLSSAQSVFSAYQNSSLFSGEEQRAQKQAVASSQIRAAFSGLGMAMPTTAAEYKALVNQQLSLGAAGAATAAQLLKLAPAFATLQDAATAIYDERRTALTAELDLARKSAELWRSAGQTLDQALNAVAAVGLSPEAQLASLRGQFAGAVDRFQGGDISAAGSVSSLAQALQTASRDYFASGAGFVSDSTSIQATLGSLSLFANAQASGADAQVAALSTQIDQMKTMNLTLTRIASSLDAIESKTSLAASAPLSAAA